MSVVHRVRLPVGATPMVEVGHGVEPAEVLATRRAPRGGISLPVALPLRRSAADAAGFLVVRPGSLLDAGAVLAEDDRGRQVRVPEACLLLGYDLDDGSAMLAPLSGSEPVLGHVRGEVISLDPDAIELRVPGALVTGVGGSGNAVHGELRVAVHEPADELRASAIDVGATGRIIVGGSRASAETLTRARAMGVAGIVLGGVLDKELRDFEATQQRRREIGGVRGDFAVLLLEGFGKVGFDPGLFAWFRAHEGRMASLFGEAARLYVYEAGPPPARRVLPRPGERVIAHRRPHAGQGGELVRVLDRLHAFASGVVGRAALVRFEDGHTAIVPLANLDATEHLPGD
ncbi:MAG: hypothetical protein M3153_01025 [Chloroflexota bacterium]|nr:hypothetical protein [Chloroflexota bacterium]